jgi:hypothetical protein
MSEEINPTTRRFPRTLREAFPQDFREWVDEPPDETIHVWDICVIAAAVIMWVFAVYCWSAA